MSDKLLVMKRLNLFVALIFCHILCASEVVDNFDLKSYDLIKVGVKDLYCEIAVDGLAKKLKEDYAAISIDNEVFYKVYWLFPGKFEIEISGVPKVFKELHESLKLGITDRIEFLFPVSLSNQLQTFQLSEIKDKEGVTLKALDPTHKNVINKMELVFNNDDKLYLKRLYGANLYEEVSLDYGKESWSKNKFVLKSKTRKIKNGMKIVRIVDQIDRENKVGFGVPEKIETVVKVSQVVDRKGTEKVVEEKRVVYRFKNYSINKGVSASYLKPSK